MSIFFIFLFCAFSQSSAFSDQPGEVYKIPVSKNGIYTITPRLLEEAGADLRAIDPRNFRMTSKGREVPIYVSGESDGRFDAGDYIEFYGQKHDRAQYTSTNVYWLSWDGEPGVRMVEEDVSLLETRHGAYKTPEQGFRQKVRFEVDNGRFQRYMRDGSTLWFWIRLNAPGLSQIPFELRHASESLENGSVRVMMYGSTQVRHNMEIFLNAGFKLGDVSWYGQEKYLLENSNVPNYVFNDGNNAIGIYYSPDDVRSKAEQVLLDWLEVEYWRDYSAYENYLEFSNPQNQDYGLYQFEIEGFSSPDIELFKLSSDGDIEGVSKLTGGHVEEKSGGGRTPPAFPQNSAGAESRYNLIFQDNIVQPTRYISLTSDRVEVPVGIKKDKSSHLRSADHGADYIVITHRNFYDSALMLSEFRAAQGMRTKVVDVEDIYDEFSYGIFDPAAIRGFIRYAFHNWQKPPPSYVLLLGDASWWYKRDESYVPSYTYNSKVGDPGREWGPTASDDYFVCINGDDPLPDLSIGRIPAKTDKEARGVVEKIIEYEKSPEPGEWRRSLLFLSGRQPDEPQFIFEQKAEEFISRYISSDYDVSRIYTNPGSPYFGHTSDLLNAVNEGRSFVRFAGHGGGSIWSDDDLLTLEDVPLLKNAGRLPFIASWTCFTAWFDNPYTNCLAEDLIFLKDGGAVAFFGSTGLGLLYADLYLEEEMYNALFKKGERVLGRLIAEAKASFLTRFAGRRDYVDLAATYTLIGDPATRLILPADARTFPLPDLVVSSSDISLTPVEADEGYVISVTVRNIGSADASNVTMRVSEGDPFREGASDVGLRRIASIPRGGAITVDFPLLRPSTHPESRIFVWVDPSNEIPEENESNNLAQLVLVSNMSVVTPEAGSGGPRASSDGIFICNIPEGTVLSRMYLTIAQVDASQLRDTQPDISYAPLPGATEFLAPPGYAGADARRAYEIRLSSKPVMVGSFSTSSPENVEWGHLKAVEGFGKPITVSFRYDPSMLEQEKLSIYQRLEDVERWIICDTRVQGEGIISAEVLQTGIFALLINNDLTIPEINVTLKEQGFMSEDYVSSTPQVSILAEDANGIKDVRVLLDGVPASHEEISVSGTIGLTPFPVEYHPMLDRGRHIVEVEAHDLNGLSATSSLTITVEPEFRIEDIANRPNPCSRRTLFTYVLTQPADDMTIRVYSASGRLIRKLDAPTSAGYNELLWNLRDEDDRPTANGAYFYKLTARREGKKVERIGKLAVLK